MVPRMQSRANSILEAQQARGLRIEGSLARRVKALIPLIGPVLLGSLIIIAVPDVLRNADLAGKLFYLDVLATLAATFKPRWQTGALL